MTDERIAMLNPKTGEEDTRIRVAMYEPVKAAILETLAELGEVSFKDLRVEVEKRTSPELWLAASPGCCISVSASGPEAEKALDALETLIADRFGEDS